MKKKVVTLLLALTMAGSLIACGSETADSESKNPAAEVKEETKENEPVAEDEATPEASEEKKADGKAEMWGAYYEGVMDTGEGKAVSYAIQFPSLVPCNTVRIAYQMDPTLALVGSGGADYRAESLEDVLPACMERITSYIESYREWNYSDFVFNIDTTELVTIEDMPMCKYTGTHTFKVDEEAYEIPFVAYAADLQEGAEAYMYLMVLDESVLHPDRPAVEEGVIEDYAYRMAQSLHVR